MEVGGVIHPTATHRSYIVETPTGQLCRNCPVPRLDLRVILQQSDILLRNPVHWTAFQTHIQEKVRSSRRLKHALADKRAGQGVHEGQQLDNVTNFTAACGVVHNICELMGDLYHEKWINIYEEWIDTLP